MRTLRSTFAALVLPIIAGPLVAGRPLRAQDSVIILRGGEPVRSTPVLQSAGRPPLDPADLPDFLTPRQCARLVQYRDGELARRANAALARERVNADAAVDMSALRADFERNYTITQWLAMRNSLVFVARETKNRVEDAFRLAEFLALPDGSPKPLARIVTDLVDESGPAGADAIVEGKMEEYRRRINAAARDLDGALQDLLRRTETVSRAEDLRRAQAEMDELRRTRLPDIDARIAAYRAAVRAANRDLTNINDELHAIDAAVRKACQS